MEISCAICMESFGTNCVIATIPCAHVFHEACIKKWHSAQKNCAQCRKKFRAEEIVRLYVSENESALNDNIFHKKYQEIILKLKKEINDLKFDKLNENGLIERNLILKEKNLRLEKENNKYLLDSFMCTCALSNSSSPSLKTTKNQSALKDNNVDKLKLTELSSEILRLKTENLRLEEENYPLMHSEVFLNTTILELKEDNNNLSNKLEDLKIHERKTQKMLRQEIDCADSKLIEMNFNLNMQIEETNKAKKEILALEAKIDLADSKLIEINFNLNMQIGETKKAKKEILALEAKCITKVPSDQIPRRNDKRKPEITGELQSKSATIKLPQQKKIKQTAQKQPTAESKPKVTYVVPIPISEDLRSLGLSQVYMYNNCKHSGLLIKEDN